MEILPLKKRLCSVLWHVDSYLGITNLRQFIATWTTVWTVHSSWLSAVKSVMSPELQSSKKAAQTGCCWFFHHLVLLLPLFLLKFLLTLTTKLLHSHPPNLYNLQTAVSTVLPNVFHPDPHNTHIMTLKHSPSLRSSNIYRLSDPQNVFKRILPTPTLKHISPHLTIQAYTLPPSDPQTYTYLHWTPNTYRHNEPQTYTGTLNPKRIPAQWTPNSYFCSDPQKVTSTLTPKRLLQQSLSLQPRGPMIILMGWPYPKIEDVCSSIDTIGGQGLGLCEWDKYRGLCPLSVSCVHSFKHQ